MSDASKLLTPPRATWRRGGRKSFLPRRFLRNGHLQTLVGNFLPRQYVLPEPEAHIIEVDPGQADAGIGISAGRLEGARTVRRSRGGGPCPRRKLRALPLPLAGERRPMPDCAAGARS